MYEACSQYAQGSCMGLGLLNGGHAQAAGFAKLQTMVAVQHPAQSCRSVAAALFSAANEAAIHQLTLG